MSNHINLVVTSHQVCCLQLLALCVVFCSRYSCSLWTGRSGDRIPVGSRFQHRQDGLWGPTRLLCFGYRVSFPVAKRPGRGVNHPLPFNAEVKESLELYLCSPSGPSWPELGRTLPFYMCHVLKLTRRVS